MNKIELLVDRLQTARRWTLGLLEDIGEANWFFMPGAGIGHVAWQVGHLAASQVALIHVRCFEKNGDECLPGGFRQTFGRGSTPSDDKGHYPSIAGIRSVFDRVHEDAVTWLAEMKEDQLAAKAGEDPHPLFETKEGAIGTAIMHECFHAGPIAMLRRLMGKKPLR